MSKKHGRKLDMQEVFDLDAKVIAKAREMAHIVHGSNIKAAGNEIEQEVRNYLRRMLPPTYYVTHGHLIDTESNVSPQLDVIIADSFSLPSLLTTKDGTEYVPATSVFAIGEVKSTYYHAKKYYEDFRDTLAVISQMNRPLVTNTAYKGVIDGSTTIRDMALVSTDRKYKNNLYSFLLCVDGGDFDSGKIRDLLTSENVNHLPNTAVFLNKGIVAYANRKELGELHKYPNEVDRNDYGWCFAQLGQAERGTIEGSHLAFLYGQLISHISDSLLEPADANDYVDPRMRIASKSTYIQIT